MKRLVFLFLVFIGVFTTPPVVYAQYATAVPTGTGCECNTSQNCAEYTGSPNCSESFGSCGDGVTCPVGTIFSQSSCGGTVCGTRCTTSVTCATGLCQGPTCQSLGGTFNCGDQGCDVCSRNVGITNCSGVFCAANCKPDATCGVGCSASTIPGSSTPIGGSGSTNTPAGPTTAPPPGASLTPTTATTPVTTGTVYMRAVQVSTGDTTCGTIRASTAGVIPTTFTFTVTSPSQPSITQDTSGYVNVASIPTGTYTLVPSPSDANWVLARACWSLSTGTSGEGLSAALGTDQTIVWDVGYTLGVSWFQAEGGDVYASGAIRSYIPNGLADRVFNVDGGTGYPGVVTYGSSYDFDSDSTETGSAIVSSTNWLANATRSTTDYYQLLYHRYNSPSTPDYTNPSSPITKPAYRITPYYVSGDMTTSGNWTVGSGESIVFLVDGDLTIDGDITIAGDGFISFVVNGNIAVSPTVGGLYTSSTPVVEGLYITSPTGTFSTGQSSSSGNERFIGKGIFIAGNFLFERDLEAVSANTTTAAELFTYNPQLLLTMPDSMKDLPMVWQEVAP